TQEALELAGELRFADAAGLAGLHVAHLHFAVLAFAFAAQDDDARVDRVGARELIGPAAFAEVDVDAEPARPLGGGGAKRPRARARPLRGDEDFAARLEAGVVGRHAPRRAQQA